MKWWSLEPLLKSFFYKYGKFVNRYRWLCFIGPLIITPILSLGFLKAYDLLLDDPAYTFTPYNARWKSELKAFTDIWPMDENKFIPGKSFEMKRFVNILVRCKDGGDILRPHILDEIELLNQFIMNNISVKTTDQQFNLTYQDLCLNYEWKCGGNEHILMFKEMSKLGRVIDLKYPKGGNDDTPAYLGTAIGDVVINETDQTVVSAHITQLIYFLKQETPEFLKYSSDFSYEIEKFILHRFQSDLIDLSFMHYQSLQDGLNENANSFGINFIISFITLFVFSIICSFAIRNRSGFKVDWIRSKPLVACCGLFNTLIALLSSFGFLMLCNVQYNVLNTIIPFLIIAIGIDDMFIMNACWDQTDPSLSVEVRMAQMMEHSAVAISITNITDILSFFIGAFSSLPGINLFCIYAATAVIFCYTFQLTFFSGFTAIMGHCEFEERHSIFLYKVKKSNNEKKCSKVHDLTLDNIRSIYISDDVLPPMCIDGEKHVPPNEVIPGKLFSKSIHQPNVLVKKVPSQTTSINGESVIEDGSATIRRFFSNKYSPFILNNKIRFLTMTIYILYLVGSIIGSSMFREGLEPKNLVTNTHYISKYFRDMTLFWEKGPQLHVLVKEKVNFTDPTQRSILLGLVNKFEHTEYTMSREGTVFFLLEYMNYLEQLNAEPENTDAIWNKKLFKWLKNTGAATQWEQDIKYNDNKTQIEAFRFTVAMKNMVTPNQHKLATKLLRQIADDCPFKVDVYHEAFPFADQYLIIMSSTLQNVLISLFCMITISFLLIPSFPSAAIIAIMICSISCGVFGYMTFWGVNLDAVSMISLIMCIGFAVDLSAHIIYAFVASPGNNSKEKVTAALAHLGWPILQGASSTIAGISILYTVDAYIILTFFKTIWLTMFIGMLHGLIFIPVILSFIPLSFFHIRKSDSSQKNHH